MSKHKKPKHKKNPFLSMRSDKRPHKTSFLIDQAVIEEGTPLTPIKRAVYNDVKGVRTYRPVSEITQRSMTGSPLSVVTPNKTELTLTGNIGFFRFFSNLPAVPVKVQTSLDPDSAFYKSDAYQAIKEILETVKLQDIPITSGKRYSGRRVKSQNRVMTKDHISEKRGSATAYAKATELFSGELRWEWLHLVAHMIGGKDSQQTENLVGGTAHANTWMMLAEGEINYLAEQYKEGIRLQIRANLIPGTHIATEIEYTMTAGKFSLPFTFNAQSSSAPHVDFQDYLHSFIKALVEPEPNQQKQTTPTSPMPLLFVNKRKPDPQNPPLTPDKDINHTSKKRHI